MKKRVSVENEWETKVLALGFLYRSLTVARPRLSKSLKRATEAAVLLKKPFAPEIFH